MRCMAELHNIARVYNRSVIEHIAVCVCNDGVQRQTSGRETERREEEKKEKETEE